MTLKSQFFVTNFFSLQTVNILMSGASSLCLDISKNIFIAIHYGWRWHTVAIKSMSDTSLSQSAEIQVYEVSHIVYVHGTLLYILQSQFWQLLSDSFLFFLNQYFQISYTVFEKKRARPSTSILNHNFVYSNEALIHFYHLGFSHNLQCTVLSLSVNTWLITPIILLC